MRDLRIFVGPIAAVVLGSMLLVLGFPLDKTIILSALVGILPLGLLKRSRWKEVRGVEENLADFLRDVSESVRSGIPLYQAIVTAAEGDYGKLTPHIRRMRREISAGLSFEEALERFAKRVAVPRVGRAVSLILRASRAGGKIADVMETASVRTRELSEHSEKRRSGMMIYTMISYISFFVFLTVVYALARVFIPAMAEATAAGGSGVVLHEEIYRNLLFYLAVAQGGAAGILAGKLGEGEVVAGLKHSVVLIAVAYIFFFVL